jgi:hypothetical protein
VGVSSRKILSRTAVYLSVSSPLRKNGLIRRVCQSSRLFYLLLAVGIAGTAWAAGPIHLKTRNLTSASYPAAQALHAVPRGPGHLLVQFARTPGADTIRELRRRGATIVGSAPDGGLTISTGQTISLEGLDVQWAGPLLPEDKISPLLSAASAIEEVVVEFHPDVQLRRVLAVLRSQNVQVLRHPNLAFNHILIAAAPAALAALAGHDEVAYIFPASPDLIQGNRVMACAGAMMAAGPVGQYVTVGSGWGPPGPDGVVELDYVFSQMSAKLPPASAQSEILRALEEWAKYAKLRFVPGTGAAAAHTVAVMFAQGVHGDGYPFQPGSLVLAHTFFPAPPNPEPIAGDMHLNEDQNWHIGSDIDLYTVALHEAGHALGLGHTDDPNSVMYPYYRFGAVLSPDDIAGIQGLYGSRDVPTKPADPPVTVTITTPPSPALATAGSSILISGMVTGGTGTLTVTWTSDQGFAGQAAGSSTWSLGPVPLNPGENGITVRAADTAGNTGSALLTITRQTTPQSPPPTPPPAPNPAPAAGPPSLNITSPSLSIVSTSLDTITLSGTASAAITAVAWTNSTGSSGNARGAATWTAPDIPLLVGTNTITVRAYDAAGNSAWRTVTVVRH